MGFAKNDKDKEFVCRQCNSFWDSDECNCCKCPDCGTDEYMFINEDCSIEEEEDEEE